VLTLAGGPVPEEVRNSINEASILSNTVIQLAMDALSKLDTTLAEQAISAKGRQTPVLKRLEEMTLDLDARAALPIYCIINSIGQGCRLWDEYSRGCHQSRSRKVEPVSMSSVLVFTAPLRDLYSLYRIAI